MGVDCRSLLYVEADARMESFADKEGNTRSNLSLIASMYRVGRRYMSVANLW
jgi:single-stranded DNA-binding protein